MKVIAVNPEGMKELKESLNMIGKATATEDRAEKLNKYYDDKTAELQKLVGGKKKKNVYLGGNASLLSTATKKMYQNSLIESAGGNNVPRDIGDTYWAEISYEQLIAYNPEVMVEILGAEYTKKDILRDEKLKGIKAVQNNQVYFMPTAIDFWAMGSFAGITDEKLISILPFL